MELKITVITENSVTKRELLAEHGLSLLIETPQYKVLFDTGQGMAVEPNLKKLRVNLQEINSIALSHGHNDHTGGLKKVLSLGGPKDVFGHPGILMRNMPPLQMVPIAQTECLFPRWSWSLWECSFI
ncbi:hypothetical protein N752_21775 [Desulforamulus aquiferis]|nr:MBL fold metallo-hydrolase [Desulforamulus aquiferis]RYD03043.1 hypothetical protein N752_21775 [Desulforamulus aquiferis]